MSQTRPRATRASPEGLIPLPGGPFLMGSDALDILPGDGEGPVRRVTVDPFFASPTPVTNTDFAAFIRATGHTTEAQRFGWSFVFQTHLPPGHPSSPVPGAPWWRQVQGAAWNHPFGPDSSLHGLDLHPVTHVSFNDALAYCHWSGARLPTEAEWEYAARGGLEQQTYPWGSELNPAGRHMCNIWQGTFPQHDLAEDGFSAPAPVHTYEPNGFGLFTVIGNVWEWCGDRFSPDFHILASPHNPTGPLTGGRRVLKGGSYLCHASYCRRYRNSARTGNSPDTSAGNIGFRVVRDF